MSKKKKQNKPEEPSQVIVSQAQGESVAEPLPEGNKETQTKIVGEQKLKTKKKAKKKKGIKYKVFVENDAKQKEIDDCEHISRNVNINHNTPGITTIKKTVVYDYITKKITKAEYEVGVK